MKNNTFHIVYFKDITNWSVSQQKEHDFGYSDSYPLVAISKFLVPCQQNIEVQDDVEYKQLTVKTKGGGVCQRCLKKGKDIKTKQQWLAHGGQFILSKIDARNGAMGVVPEDLDGAIVTHDFPLFNVKTEIINPQFLLLIITTDTFMRFAQSCSSGTTNRQRINVIKFLQQRIPLPSLDEQNKLIDSYNNIISNADFKEDQSRRMPSVINQYLIDALGLCVNKMKDGKDLKLIKFKNLSRWDYQYYKTHKKITATYKLVSIESVLSNFMAGPNNTSIRCNTSDSPNDAFTYVGMENIEKETGILIEANEILGHMVKSQTLKVPKDYIIYGKLRPYLNKYWLNETDIDNLVCSSEFFVFDIQKNVNKKYFLYLLASSFVQEQILDRYSGARMPRINEEVFKSIKIPLPPESFQREIADNISAKREKAFMLNEEAKQLREYAKVKFENTIFA